MPLHLIRFSYSIYSLIYVNLYIYIYNKSVFVGISAPKHMIFKQVFPKGTIHWNDGLDIYCFLILCDKNHIMVDAIIQYFKKNAFVSCRIWGHGGYTKKKLANNYAANLIQPI